MTLNRRDFVKRSAMAAAVAAAAGNYDEVMAATDAVAAAPAAAGTDAITPKWEKAPCRFCGTGCHVNVLVDKPKNKVIAVRGDAKAAVNKGLLCVKGYHVGLALYGKDRLTQPLLRKDGELTPVSWTEALDVLAKRIKASPKTFAYYGSGQWTIPEGYVAQKLMKGGLSNNHIDPNARLCMASAVTGFISSFGVDEPAGCYQDLDECNVLIMWGNNPAEMHPVLFSRVVDRRSKGEKILLIDISNRRTRTTEHCDHHLQFNPHTDLVIAYGIAHLLLKNGTYDKEFVAKHVNYRGDTTPPSLKGKQITFEAYEAALAKYTPEYVSKLSSISVKDIEMLAELFARRDTKITSLWCMGMNQHTQGTAVNNAVHSIHLLSGHFGKPGDAPTSLTGQPSACGTVREVGTLAHALPGGRVVANAAHRKHCEGFWNLPDGRINPKPGYHTVKMWERFCTPNDKGGDIDTIWVQVTNPGQTLPNLNKLFLGKKDLKEKFLIVSDVYPTATTELADLVLPSAMWIEKNGVVGNSERRTQQWFKMVDPPGDARDDTWQTIAVAHRLMELGHPGMKDKDGRFIFETKDDSGKVVDTWKWENYYTMNVDKHLFEEYRQFTRLKHKDLAPYDEYVKARGLRWPVVKQADGSWRETRFRFSEFDDPYVKKGSEIDFYHSTTKDGRAQVWFREYQPPPEVPDKNYPLWLCTGRVLEHWHSGTMTMRIPQLRRGMPGAYVEVNAADARAMGVSNGEKVKLETRRGSLELVVWIDGRGAPKPGNVFVPFFDETRMINLLTLDAHDPFSKQPDYKKCAARIVPLGAKKGA